MKSRHHHGEPPGDPYDGMTLDEVWPAKTPFGTHWWVNPDGLKADKKLITPVPERP